MQRIERVCERCKRVRTFTASQRCLDSCLRICLGELWRGKGLYILRILQCRGTSWRCIGWEKVGRQTFALNNC